MAKVKQYTLEYMIRSSPLVLYNFLITPTLLQQWFAEEVDSDGTTYYFTWNGSTEVAELISTEDDDFIRYRWDYYDKDKYFEFRIDKTEITDDTILYITDFAEEKEIAGQTQLWDTQIKNLIKRIGAS